MTVETHPDQLTGPPVCVHNRPIADACDDCVREITQGLASESAERVLVALESLAETSSMKMATYRFPGSWDTLAVIHRDNASWQFQDACCKSGNYAYRVQWSGQGQSEALARARGSALTLIAASKDIMLERDPPIVTPEQFR